VVDDCVGSAPPARQPTVAVGSGGGGPRDDARGGLFADRRRASSTRGPGRTTPSPHPPFRVRTRGPGGTLSALEVTRDGDPADRTVDAILAKTTGKRSVVRGRDRDGNEDLTAATVRTRAGSDRTRIGRQPTATAARTSDRQRRGSPVTPDIAALRRCLGGSERPERTAVDGDPGGAPRPEPTAGSQPNRRPGRTDRQQFGGPAAGGDRRRHASRWRSASRETALRCCWSALSRARTSPTRVSPRYQPRSVRPTGNRSGVAGGRGVENPCGRRSRTRETQRSPTSG